MHNFHINSFRHILNIRLLPADKRTISTRLDESYSNRNDSNFYFIKTKKERTFILLVDQNHDNNYENNGYDLI